MSILSGPLQDRVQISFIEQLRIGRNSGYVLAYNSEGSQTTPGWILVQCLPGMPMRLVRRFADEVQARVAWKLLCDGTLTIDEIKGVTIGPPCLRGEAVPAVTPLRRRVRRR